MSSNQSRAEFFQENPRACAWAALDEATNQQKKTTPGPIKIKKGLFAGKRAIILGSGVAGLTTAYELLAQESGMEVTILEALNRTGGRCLSVRTGDTFTEDVDSNLVDSKPGETQVVRFKRPVGDIEPYLNAGPGRIPSAHKRVLSYLRKFGVDIEVYVMNSESNLVQMNNGPTGDDPVVYRRLDHNTRGWLAEMVYQNAKDLINGLDSDLSEEELIARVKQLKSLMITFGDLQPNGKYAQCSGEAGLENASSRAGFDVLPGVQAGKTPTPLTLDCLLKSEFWKKTSFYQPVDFLWQPTLFQPVGGMDMVQHSFAQQVAALGGTIHLNSPVKSIDWDPKEKEFIIQVSQIGTEEPIEYRADYCFSNMAIPFLKNILSPALRGMNDSSYSLDGDFNESLNAVFQAQFDPIEEPDKDGYVAKFLANTTKVGWQADRSLWQGSMIAACHDKGCGEELLDVPESEVGVVPIFGGISWTDDEIKQIWYPSEAYHDEKGILTGAYNFSKVAWEWGNLPIEDRLKKARNGAKLFGEKFGDGLCDGLAIAWQNMPHIKGGWAQWHVLDKKEKPGESTETCKPGEPRKPSESVKHFNILTQGSGIGVENSESCDPVFFIVGDQMSSLPGWKEGAIGSALNALSRIARPDLEIPHLAALPDTRLMVEGV